MPDRVHSSDIQLFIDEKRVPAVESLSFSTSKNLEDIPRLGVGHITDRILGPNQSTELNYSINLTTGATGIDPFYSYQQMQSGFLSTGGFEFKVKDVAGINTISGATLTSYSLNGSVGNLTKGESTYRGDAAIFTPAGGLTISDQSQDAFGGFFAPQDIQVTTTTNGDEGINSASLHIQDFSISVSLDKKDVTRLGTRVPRFRQPELPSQGTLDFSVIKNKVTGINISSLVCESGVIKIDLKDFNGASVMNFVTSGCCLESVEESTSLDDNTTVSFSYYFPVIQ
tara:strand:- start:5663 stop:6514 length:852 start_codon:yes stop_codon:yes gene_type:complete